MNGVDKPEIVTQARVINLFTKSRDKIVKLGKTSARR